jgi:hypothetical protein
LAAATGVQVQHCGDASAERARAHTQCVDVLQSNVAAQFKAAIGVQVAEEMI